MATFTPVNSLEMKLRAILTDPNTASWNFYTPLAAAPLWIIVKNHPELDGSNLVAPPGKNPEVCIFTFPQGSFIGLYTAPGRAQQAFAQWQISQRDWTIVSAPGYRLLKFLGTSEAELCLNLGVKDCQYHLDPDLVEILLSRPEPDYDAQPVRKVNFAPAGQPEQHLAPLHEFLSRQPKVRAAWVFGQKPDPPLPPDALSYEVNLLMEDPEDKSLLHAVGVMAKALTPVEMEWTTAVITADDQSLRNLAKQTPPFYARPNFLQG
jgi:hypothetical protein